MQCRARYDHRHVVSRKETPSQGFEPMSLDTLAMLLPPQTNALHRYPKIKTRHVVKVASTQIARPPFRFPYTFFIGWPLFNWSVSECVLPQVPSLGLPSLSIHGSCSNWLSVRLILHKLPRVRVVWQRRGSRWLCNRRRCRAGGPSYVAPGSRCLYGLKKVSDRHPP